MTVTSFSIPSLLLFMFLLSCHHEEHNRIYLMLKCLREVLKVTAKNVFYLYLIVIFYIVSSRQGCSEA